MAVTTRKTKVVGNPGRKAFGHPTKSKYKKRSGHSRRNVGNIIGFTLAGNPGRKAGSNMQSKKKKKAGAGHHGYSTSYYKGKKGNPGHRGYGHKKSRYHKRNPGGIAGVGPLLSNALFVVLGAVGSKLATQMVLGSNNVGFVGYAGNAATGGLMWFLARMAKQPTMAAGFLSGTAVQIVLRLINDYTPFGQYIAQLGMGDYQMQSFVTPQVLVDPWNSAEIAENTPAWRPPAVGAGPATGIIPASTPMPTGGGGGRGTSGLYGAGGGGWGGNLYGA
jgi:hypothetical protein